MREWCANHGELLTYESEAEYVLRGTSRGRPHKEARGDGIIVSVDSNGGFWTASVLSSMVPAFPTKYVFVFGFIVGKMGSR